MRVAALVSGTGTNLQALLDAQGAGTLAPARIALVVSNRPTAPALERASVAGVPSRVLDHTKFESRDAYDRELIKVLREHTIDAVVLAGFMRILGDEIVDLFRHRILNTHPSLLPLFPGRDAAQQALDAGVKVSGCTVHIVDEGVDTGPIVAQAAVPVLPGDTAKRLHTRIKQEEHKLLPEALRSLAEGRIRVHGGSTLIESR